LLFYLALLLSLTRFPRISFRVFTYICASLGPMKVQRKKTHYASLTIVRDKNKRKISGLYKRNGRSYAQLWVARSDGKLITGTCCPSKYLLLAVSAVAAFHG